MSIPDFYVKKKQEKTFSGIAFHFSLIYNQFFPARADCAENFISRKMETGESIMKNGFLGVTAFAAALILTLGAVFSASAQEISSPVGAKHVVLIGYDGLGGNYIHWDELPNLSRFKEKGAWTQKMRSVIPSSSAINWASILMGAPSELHGFRTWGSKEPDLPSAVLTENGLFPDIFYLTRKAMPDSTLNCVYTWGGIGFLFDNKVMNDVLHAQSADEVCSKGLDYLAQNPTLTFIYFSGPDGAGHDKGWGTP